MAILILTIMVFCIKIDRHNDIIGQLIKLDYKITRIKPLESVDFLRGLKSNLLLLIPMYY